jgi:hypothetical protein
MVSLDKLTSLQSNMINLMISSQGNNESRCGANCSSFVKVKLKDSYLDLWGSSMEAQRKAL